MKTIFYSFLMLLLVSCHNNDTNKPKMDNWVISGKSVFKNVLSKEGYLDTVYRTRYVYKNGDQTDSTLSFAACIRDNNGILIGKKFYNVDKDGRQEFIGSWAFTYDKKGNITSSTKMNNGILEQQEKQQYDDSGRLAKYSAIERINNDVMQLADKDNDFKQVAAHDIVYDSTNVSYKYDRDNKVVKAIATDGAGKLVRTDINLYTGNEPFASYSINEKGDTIQKINYEMDGKFLKMTVHQDDLIITKWVSGNWMFAQVTENVKVKKKWKKILKYDLKGREIEQSTYSTE